MQTEYEARFLDIHKEDIYTKFKDLGITRIHPEILMKRKVYWVQTNKEIKRWLRVRQEREKVSLTLKQKHIHNISIDKVEEIGVKVDSFENTCKLLENLGYTLKSYEENKRETWIRKDKGIELCIDTRPGLAPYLEIEGGDEKSVTACAKSLGLQIDNAYFGSVFDTYHEILGYSYEYLMSLSKITFQNPPKKV